MKQLLLLGVVLVGSASVGLAQQLPASTNAAVASIVPTNQSSAVSVTNAAAQAEQPLFRPGDLDWLQPGSAWEMEEGDSLVAGPLSRPFLAPKSSQIPGRLLNLINPFAPLDRVPELHRTTERDLSARSWSAVVGWNPGRSAFPDETRHEAAGLIVSKCSRD